MAEDRGESPELFFFQIIYKYNIAATVLVFIPPPAYDNGTRM